MAPKEASGGKKKTSAGKRVVQRRKKVRTQKRSTRSGRKRSSRGSRRVGRPSKGRKPGRPRKARSQPGTKRKSTWGSTEARKRAKTVPKQKSPQKRGRRGGKQKKKGAAVKKRSSRPRFSMDEVKNWPKPPKLDGVTYKWKGPRKPTRVTYGKNLKVQTDKQGWEYVMRPDPLNKNKTRKVYLEPEEKTAPWPEDIRGVESGWTIGDPMKTQAYVYYDENAILRLAHPLKYPSHSDAKTKEKEKKEKLKEKKARRGRLDWLLLKSYIKNMPEAEKKRLMAKQLFTFRS